MPVFTDEMTYHASKRSAECLEYRRIKSLLRGLSSDNDTDTEEKAKAGWDGEDRRLKRFLDAARSGWRRDEVGGEEEAEEREEREEEEEKVDGGAPFAGWLVSGAAFESFDLQGRVASLRGTV